MTITGFFASGKRRSNSSGAYHRASSSRLVVHLAPGTGMSMAAIAAVYEASERDGFDEPDRDGRRYVAGAVVGRRGAPCRRPVIVDDVVRDIDAIVKEVRFAQ